MICHIIRKEVLGNLLSSRFVLSLVLIVSLFAVSGFVFVNKHKQQLQDYWKETNDNLAAFEKNSTDLVEMTFHTHKLWKKPQTLSFCSEGFDNYLPNKYKFDVFINEYPALKNRSNLLVSRFSNIDWCFIISLVLSFTAMVFVFDSICGEKQTGTLRLMLAGSVPRYKILFAKYCGAMLTLVPLLFLGLLINLIIITSSNVFNIGIDHWVKIIAIIALSVLYLSIFVLLGIFVSSRTAYSSSSMVTLLLVWVILVIMVPSFGRIVSKAFYKIPTYGEAKRMHESSAKQIFKWIYEDKYGKNATRLNPDRNSPDVNPPAHAKGWQVYIGSMNRIFEDHHNKMLAQTLEGRKLTLFSPSVIYQRASETLAGTGIRRSLNLYHQIKGYQADLMEFIRTKDAEDPDSLHLIYAEKRMVLAWRSISKVPVDFSTVPKFAERDLGLGESLQLVIWDIGLLALFNLAFFAAAFVSFLRYDVR